MEFAESEPDPPENHVVLNSDVIRSIWFRPCNCIMAWGGTSTRLERDMSYWTENFLYNTYVMGSQNMSLELEWDRFWHGRGNWNTNWSITEEKLLAMVDNDWNGRFRKVRIILLYYSKEGNGLQKMVELAEKRAKELLGECSATPKLGWLEEKQTVEDGSPKWERYLVGERKI